MPIHKDCVKRMRQSAKERERNRAKRSRIRAAIKALRAETKKDEAAKLYREVTSLLDRAASDGLIHRSNANRNKSRLAAVLSRLG
ncbi:MAG: 30S ribosomal protein S20 [Candidatus Zixiibacteriota bacterium]